MKTRMAGWWKGKNYHGAPDAVYGLGLVGAAFYFLQHAANFQEGLIGLLKALVWPAVLVYKLFELLGP